MPDSIKAKELPRGSSFYSAWQVWIPKKADYSVHDHLCDPYLVIDIMESAFVDKYAKAHLFPGGEIFMLDKFGIVISSRPKHQIGTKLQVDYLPQVLEGTKGYFQSTDTNGERKMIIYDTSEVTGFKMVSVIPVKEVIKESESIRILTFVVLLIGILAAY